MLHSGIENILICIKRRVFKSNAIECEVILTLVQKSEISENIVIFAMIILEIFKFF